MVALIQRVQEASVTIDGQVAGAIGRGMLILLGVHKADTEAEGDWVARKCVNLRLFPDDEGRMNRSLLDIGGEALVVSQFTLYGNPRKGTRPSFDASAPPERAEPLYEAFVDRLQAHLGRPVPTGEFGAMMKVHLVNDGPVTLWVEKKAAG